MIALPSSRIAIDHRRRIDHGLKDELVRCLDSRVFDPILNAAPEKYKGDERDDLHYVQDRTRSEKDRYHRYGSADEVIRMYKDDLHSENAKPVNSRPERLGLPGLEDIRENFEKKA